jgi:hypothetical protein
VPGSGVKLDFNEADSDLRKLAMGILEVISSNITCSTYIGDNKVLLKVLQLLQHNVSGEFCI